MTDKACWWRRSAVTSTALALMLGACSGGDEGGGGEGSLDDAAAVAIVTETGDAIAGIQNERCAVRRTLGGSEERCEESLQSAEHTTDEGLRDLTDTLHDGDLARNVELTPMVSQTVTDLTELRGQVLLALPSGGGSVDDDGATAALYNPMLTDVLQVHLHYADLVEDEETAALAQLYARTTLQIEDVDHVAALASGDPDAWPSQIGALYDATIAGRDRVLDLAGATDLADATAELEAALTNAGFGSPPPPAAPSGGDPFVASLSLESWRDYRDAVRDRLDALR
jgi:hypothetical protein